MIYPQASAGHFVRQGVSTYAEMDLDELAEQYYQCMPFEACVGSCTVAQLLPAQPDYSLCSGAMGEESCNTAYRGDRCSECVAYDPTRGECSDSDTETNGYYRLNNICEPCTCSWFTFNRIVVICFVLVLVVMVVADHFLKEVDHMSTCT
jgi:hypothetical protein